MKQRTVQQRRLLLAAFVLPLLLLAGLLWQGIRRGDTVRVGVPRSASAMGAVLLLQTPSAQYQCTVGSTSQALATALRAGELDAALLPRELALSLEDCKIRAVVGYAPLLVMSRQAEITGLPQLKGQTLTLAETLRDTLAEGMLQKALQAAETPVRIAYGNTGDPILCDFDAAAALLTAEEGWHAVFSLADAWKKWLPDARPAGLCLVVRQEYLNRAGSDYAAFERALQSSLQYSDKKRKKTAAMAAAAGLTANEAIADALYPYIDFVWLTGQDMADSLNAVR